ncbi:MAG: response regulator [Pseudomonadota bacterium]
MSMSQTIAPHLPYLRRYARALAGNQASGDAYVVSVLETLVAAPESFPADQDPRIAVYQVFSRIWNSVPVNLDEKEGDAAFAAQRHLDAITPMPRQAFLLTAVEGFSNADAATILGLDSQQLRELLDKAGEEIASQMATDVLIIEDEPIIAMDLEALVEGLGHTVNGVARTHSEAIKAVETRQPGLVLADIQLADGSSGLDAVNEMLGSFEVPVIFITAYPERLLTGERPEPAFLITKPFQADTVKAIISQALFFNQKAYTGENRASA